MTEARMGVEARDTTEKSPAKELVALLRNSPGIDEETTLGELSHGLNGILVFESTQNVRELKLDSPAGLKIIGDFLNKHEITPAQFIKYLIDANEPQRVLSESPKIAETAEQRISRLKNEERAQTGN